MDCETPRAYLQRHLRRGGRPQPQFYPGSFLPAHRWHLKPGPNSPPANGLAPYKNSASFLPTGIGARWSSWARAWWPPPSPWKDHPCRQRSASGCCSLDQCHILPRPNSRRWPELRSVEQACRIDNLPARIVHTRPPKPHAPDCGWLRQIVRRPPGQDAAHQTECRRGPALPSLASDEQATWHKNAGPMARPPVAPSSVLQWRPHKSSSTQQEQAGRQPSSAGGKIKGRN